MGPCEPNEVHQSQTKGFAPGLQKFPMSIHTGAMDLKQPC